jgi:hypothetical protein
VLEERLDFACCPQTLATQKNNFKDGILTEPVQPFTVLDQCLLLLPNLVVQVDGLDRPSMAGAGERFFEPVGVFRPGKGSLVQDCKRVGIRSMAIRSW